MTFAVGVHNLSEMKEVCFARGDLTAQLQSGNMKLQDVTVGSVMCLQDHPALQHFKTQSKGHIFTSVRLGFEGFERSHLRFQKLLPNDLLFLLKSDDLL